jgi:peptide/nickel transport system ATP-binding protein
MTETLLRVEGLVREYQLPRRTWFSPVRYYRVLHGVELTLAAGTCLGIVGESGSGKSTLARTVLALERPQAGRVLLRGEDVFALTRRGLRRLRRHMQAVFQDPYGSLDPRHTIGRIVAEPVASLEPGVERAERRRRTVEMLEAVGLPADAIGRYPHEFSGGQRQRVAIARALVTYPSLIVADEPVSALDVSVQAQVLNLMSDLQARFGLAYLFISHDLGVVRWIADRIAVMYLGRIVEEGPSSLILDAPRHPYTRALLDAVPRPGFSVPAEAQREHNEPPSHGCSYAPRCPLAEPRCGASVPALRAVGEGRVACHLARSR